MTLLNHRNTEKLKNLTLKFTYDLRRSYCMLARYMNSTQPLTHNHLALKPLLRFELGMLPAAGARASRIKAMRKRARRRGQARDCKTLRGACAALNGGPGTAAESEHQADFKLLPCIEKPEHYGKSSQVKSAGISAT
jgi:hypothetical protein